MASQIAHHLAAAGGMSDLYGVVQIEVFGQRSQVVGVVVHVMAVAGLGGSAVAAPVVSDHPVAVLQEKQHLRVPVISCQRPTKAEHDGLACAPVLVENLRAIGCGDRAHAVSTFDCSSLVYGAVLIPIFE